MQDRQKRPRRFTPRFLTVVAVSAFLVGGGTALLAVNTLMSFRTSQERSQPTISQPRQSPVSQQPSPTSEATSQPTISQPTPTPVSQQPSTEGTTQVYWLNATGDKIELLPAPISIAKSAEPKQILDAAFEQLLAGPPDSQHSTTIPQGTKLLGLKVAADGVRINLSQEFINGGGSSSMSARLGQVLYTATSLDPTQKVWLDVEGKPLEVLGGEGLMLEQPLTREYFEQNFQL